VSGVGLTRQCFWGPYGESPVHCTCSAHTISICLSLFIHLYVQCMPTVALVVQETFSSVCCCGFCEACARVCPDLAFIHL